MARGQAGGKREQWICKFGIGGGGVTAQGRKDCEAQTPGVAQEMIITGGHGPLMSCRFAGGVRDWGPKGVCISGNRCAEGCRGRNA